MLFFVLVSKENSKLQKESKIGITLFSFQLSEKKGKERKRKRKGDNLEYKPLCHSPYGTTTCLCISGRKLAVGSVLTDPLNYSSDCIIFI